MKKSLSKITLAILLIGLPFIANAFLANGQSHAYTNSDMIDDSVFDNTNSMSAVQIQNFLNQFPNSCIKNYSAPDPTGYFTFGAMVSAAQVIKDASHIWGINPQVVLATMEKEEQLVDGSQGCASWKYWSAMGYRCPSSDPSTFSTYTAAQAVASPDSYSGGVPADMQGSIGPTCVDAAYAVGFSAQVDEGAYQLEFARQRSEGNGNLSWDGDGNLTYPGDMTAGCRARVQGGAVVCYDGSLTLSGQTFIVANGATASLYSYTPFLQSFDVIFEGFFGAGSTSGVPYSATYIGQSSYPTISPGGTATGYFEYQNTGNTTWYDDTSANGASALPVHLATTQPLNRASIFAGGNWGAGGNRPDLNFSTVYNSDGTTLATNQHVVSPGQYAVFAFTFTAPANATPGTYQENFAPIVEGTSSGAFADPGTYIDVTIPPVYSLSTVTQSAAPTLRPGQSGTGSFEYKNTGNTPWYDDTSVGSAPSGTLPVHLATSHSVNRASIFAGGNWGAGGNRPDLNFSTVYNSDGTTLATNQHVAQPGQIVKYIINFTVPTQQSAGTYQEYFQPILEGSSDGTFADPSTSISPVVASAAVGQSTDATQSFQMTPGGTQNITLHFKNVGNVTWNTGTRLIPDPSTSAGSFKDSGWPSGTLAANLNETSVAPGAIGSFTFTIDAPLAGGNYTLGFAPSNDTTFFGDPADTITATVAPANYSATYQTESSWPTIIQGQTATGFLEYKNTGNVPWYDNNSVGSAPAGSFPVHLATSQPINRNSTFAGGNWGTGGNRPDLNFSTVYNSDGTTTSSNQDEVLPGQYAKFSFTFTTSTSTAPATYQENFAPVAEGTANGAFNNPGTYLDVVVQSANYSAQFVGQSSYPSIVAGSTGSGSFSYKNTGNVPWYDDTSIGSAPAGSFPVHLATSHPINRASIFGATWGGNKNRPDSTFSMVYNSDGTTLASNQHVAQPGQIVKFSFTFTAAANQAPGIYREFFAPVAEGTSNGAFNDPGTYLDVTVP